VAHFQVSILPTGTGSVPFLRTRGTGPTMAPPHRSQRMTGPLSNFFVSVSDLAAAGRQQCHGCGLSSWESGGRWAVVDKQSSPGMLRRGLAHCRTDMLQNIPGFVRGGLCRSSAA
jgi:hypothetical protein